MDLTTKTDSELRILLALSLKDAQQYVGPDGCIEREGLPGFGVDAHKSPYHAITNEIARRAVLAGFQSEAT